MTGMNCRNFVTGLAAVPIAVALPAAATPDPVHELDLIRAINRATAERIELRQAGAPPAAIEACDRSLQSAARTYGRFLDRHRRELATVVDRL